MGPKLWYEEVGDDEDGCGRWALVKEEDFEASRRI